MSKQTFKREQLFTPLSRVIGAVERKATMAVLSCVLIQCKDGLMTMTCTNLEIQLSASTELPNAADFATLVPARKFLDILRALPPSADVDISMAAERMTITSGHARFALGTLPPDTFPAFDTGTIDATYYINPAWLRHVIKQCAPCMGISDARYYLNGMRLQFEGDALNATSSDGHRMALQYAALSSKVDKVREMIVPRTAALELSKLLPEESQPEPAAINVNDRTVTVEMPGMTFSSKLIEGRYPDINRVIPKGFDAEFVTNRAQLIDAIRRVSILSNDHNAIAVKLSDGLMKLSAANVDQEESADAISVECDADVNVGFNAAYLLDCLANIETDAAMVQMNNEGVTIFRAQNDTPGFYLVMPMRL